MKLNCEKSARAIVAIQPMDGEGRNVYQSSKRMGGGVSERTENEEA
jgi:hypothetical protein